MLFLRLSKHIFSSPNTNGARRLRSVLLISDQVSDRWAPLNQEVDFQKEKKKKSPHGSKCYFSETLIDRTSSAHKVNKRHFFIWNCGKEREEDGSGL
jgi:hypothetical protein